MNYKKIYDRITKRAINRIPQGYTETHHIVPKCMGGTDNKDNLVELSAREHFICHYLLAKMYNEKTNEWYRLNNAFLMMKASSLNQNRYYNSRLYESLRCSFSEVMRMAQSGKNNSQYDTVWICNPNSGENKKVQKNLPLSEGWFFGRNKTWEQINLENEVKQFFNSIDIEIYNKLGYSRRPQQNNFDLVKQQIECYKLLLSKKQINGIGEITEKFPLVRKGNAAKLLKLTGCENLEKRGGFREQTTKEYLKRRRTGRVT